MTTRASIFTTIRTEGALLPADLLQRISEGATLDGLTSESYHHPGEKLNEAINRSWNALQGVWASFRAAQERLPESDLGTSLTRERWLLPLFRELDYGRLQSAPAYEIEGRTYPISHTWEQVPIHLVSYKVDLDTRTRGVAGAATASPHSLVQVFLNRSDDNLWGFLSNGYKLRILRDNASLTRQAYVEFDLEAMMDGEVYSDFVLLWLLCHQSRVEGAKPSECWLEKWMKVAEDQGTRALDDLRNGVEAAITALGLGFLEHPANADLRDKLSSGSLSGQDAYRQLLRLVYRLLFLFVAEDRDLLLDPHADAAARERYSKYYSTQRLRQMAETFKGTRHPDLYEGLRLIMRLLSGDALQGSVDGAGAGLGLVPLGSFLFSDRAVPDVIDCQISNQHFLDAIRALSLTYDTRAQVYRSVDYRNLGPEELGSIYESLLELHPQINVPARRFALATAGGNERKTTGSYYTPTSLINALLDSALDPVLNEAAKQGEAAILNLTICDPACGSGHFLIAAAGRMAKALAAIRTGEEEPPPAAIQAAKRDIIGRCIYGVDINPMAVELCKVNLWMEALEPGKPLSFLESHIRVGNSLLGTTPRLMAGGIPDDAFNPIEGDDKKIASELKKKNKDARKEREKLRGGQGSFFDLVEPPADYAALTRAAAALNTMDDDTLDDLRRKEAAFAALATDGEARKAQLLADAWCAAFVWEKGAASGMTPLTDLTYRRLEDTLRDDRALTPDLIAVINEVERLRERYAFFHWHVTFPEVFPVPDDLQHAENEATGWSGGFSCVLGNPPWERIKIQEKEWFAERAPEIATAPNAAARKRMIEALINSDLTLLEAFRADQRVAEGESHFVRVSDRFSLTGYGSVNTYALFSETALQILAPEGYLGIITPTGIATDDTTSKFFQHLIQNNKLISLFDFENRLRIFVDVAPPQKFCLLTASGRSLPNQDVDFVFFAATVADLDDMDRHFSLSADDFTLISPNTRTCPLFRRKRDAELIRRIYQFIPVISSDNDSDTLNPWQIVFSRMFHMADDSSLFHTFDQLVGMGYTLQGSSFSNGKTEFLPLYEAKLFHQYNHRYNTYAGVAAEDMFNVKAFALPLEEKLINPHSTVLPRYWISENEVQHKWKTNFDWVISFRDITNVTTNRRTAIFCILPKVALGHVSPILGLPHNRNPREYTLLYNNLNSIVFDYAVRQSIGGSHLTYSILKQLPVIPPHTYTPALLDFIVPRVLELTYTAWDLQAFAQDIGYQGAPFIWDEDRRFLMRCELDALYFHLYQISREDVDYIMETFPIVKRKDVASYGSYRTKETIIAMYDQMAGLPKLAVPAPKDEHATYQVPDVSAWVSPLNPPPGDQRAGHEA